MLGSLNRVSILGRMGTDPIIYRTKYYKFVMFPVVTNDYYVNKRTGKLEETVQWHNVVCFGKEANFANKFLYKGDAVFIEGPLRTYHYLKNGKKFYNTSEILCKRIVALSVVKSKLNSIKGRENFNKIKTGENVEKNETPERETEQFEEPKSNYLDEQTEEKIFNIVHFTKNFNSSERPTDPRLIELIGGEVPSLDEKTNDIIDENESESESESENVINYTNEMEKLMQESDLPSILKSKQTRFYDNDEIYPT